MFAGELFEVFRWEQELFDGSVKQFEKVRRPDTALVLPVFADRLRITRQEQPGCREPFFALIGGRIESGEPAEAAARRELLEEAGLVAGSLELWAALQPFAKIDWAVFIFVARMCTVADGLTFDPGERIDLIDVSLDELLTIVRAESFRDIAAALQLLRNAADPAQLASMRSFLGLHSPTSAS